VYNTATFACSFNISPASAVIPGVLLWGKTGVGTGGAMPIAEKSRCW